MRKTAKNRGVALIIVVFAMMLFAMLGWTLVSLISGNFEANTRYVNSEQALYLAEAGAYWARNQLHQNTSWRTNSSFGYPSGYAQFSLGTGEFQVVCRDPQATESGNVIIISSGYVPAQSNYLGMRQIKLTLTLNSSFSLGNALFSGSSVNMSGNSRVYNGDVLADGTVSMSGNAGITNGDITQNATTPTLPSIIVPANIAALPSSGALTVAGNNTSTLNAGNYKYSSLNLSGNSKLIINGPVNLYLTGAQSMLTSGNSNITIASGPVTIYVDGGVSIGGNGIVSNSHNVNDLTILGTINNTSDINLAGNGNFYGVIYAPTTDLTISGNGGYYGSYAGNSVTMSGNASIHYDPSLSTRTIEGSGGVAGGSVSCQEV
ncbi:MAG: hypothetical protein PHN57_02185 [Candidatus Omnitrophica bacterium]|nr:hypothetical protein [Candidatus Omnitrophota bacterium]